MSVFFLPNNCISFKQVEPDGDRTRNRPSSRDVGVRW